MPSTTLDGPRSEELAQTLDLGRFGDAAVLPGWDVEDVVGVDEELDFGRRFLPEALARVDDLAFLDRDEKRALDQVRANAYLHLLGLAEEFVLPFTLGLAIPTPSGETGVRRIRALLDAAADEAKHVETFRELADRFEQGFPTPCDTIGPAAELARAMLAHDSLAAALAVLHFTCMTERHRDAAVEDDRNIDPRFRRLLDGHWQDEVAHVGTAVQVVEELAHERCPEAIGRAVGDYVELIAFFEDGLARQVEHDLAAFAHHVDRALTAGERAAIRENGLAAAFDTYLGSGMTHPRFLETVGRLGSAARHRLERVGRSYCP